RQDGSAQVAPLLRWPAGQEVPHADLRDQAQRVEPAGDDGRFLPVADVEAAATPKGPNDHGHGRGTLVLPQQRPRRGGAGAVARRAAASDVVPEAEVGRRPDEERLYLGGVEAGELRPIAPLESVTACRPSHREDRNTSRGKRLRVALDGAVRDLELLGELRDGQLPSGLQEDQERDEAARAHRAERNSCRRQKMTGIAARVFPVKRAKEERPWA